MNLIRFEILKADTLDVDRLPPGVEGDKSLMMWKELCRTGQFTDANGVEHTIDRAFLQNLVKQFWERKDKGIEVPCPVGHTHDPEAKRGRVIFLEIRDRGQESSLYGIIEFVSAEAKNKLCHSDVSIESPEISADGDGQTHYFALEHVAFTDYPVVAGLDDFKDVVFSLIKKDEKMAKRKRRFDQDFRRELAEDEFDDDKVDFGEEDTSFACRNRRMSEDDDDEDDEFSFDEDSQFDEDGYDEDDEDEFDDDDIEDGLEDLDDDEEDVAQERRFARRRLARRGGRKLSRRLARRSGRKFGRRFAEDNRDDIEQDLDEQDKKMSVEDETNFDEEPKNVSYSNRRSRFSEDSRDLNGDGRCDTCGKELSKRKRFAFDYDAQKARLLYDNHCLQIEGLARDGLINPRQAAFIESKYCSQKHIQFALDNRSDDGFDSLCKALSMGSGVNFDEKTGAQFSENGNQFLNDGQNPMEREFSRRYGGNK